ncbi:MULTISPECIES: AMP-binding protein [Flavobacterium]|uniref:AMP-binding protein n=1 Tax=Flavobacterium gawalongense TaxID=2594432 RepID=A0A553BS02_9FLAO|nr:AMP-binding protein [Flavobacterium gawalongense]TRX03150.1 AMP-binding protein [Flavobacterium gawalongense]TRX09812.1 AMP-binding protein [Flavobacterium gawalongense]TRX11038.1 AMP-binding protein [Flavobacterium gawalongense]TRX11999.1 AMP-binding protein [Flavobacterium gawalongense]TRX29845.1 AMP-binding protein [Flavobacterium gawalongense]
MDKITYKNVNNHFKLNGFHLNRKDLCRVAYSFIKEGEEHEKSVGDFILDWFDKKSYIELNTSGTTGSPKIIQMDKQAMINSALATGDFFDLRPGDKALHCLPTKYIAGKMMFVRGFILGLDMDFVAPSSHPMLHNDTKYDFVAMVPLQAQNSLKELKNVKKMIVGGAKMSKSLENSLSKLSTKGYETYGMTETITHIAAKKIGGKAFSVLPNIKISHDDRNCLVIDAPKISEEKIVTNDLVDLINENEFIFLGRIDNVINSGGIKLIPEQIEEKLSNKIHSRFFVTGIQDATLGEKLALIIEGEKQLLDETIFDGLDKYEKPKEVFYVSKFIETQNGKIKRKEILERI